MRRLLAEEQVAVPALHTVFEPPAAMIETALEARLYAYRVGFPAGFRLRSACPEFPLVSPVSDASFRFRDYGLGV